MPLSMPRLRLHDCCALAAALLGLVSTPLPGAAQESDEPKVTLPPFTVYGDLQRDPTAATTVPEKLLERRVIHSVVDLWRAVPNLTQAHAGLRSLSDNYSIRGIGNTEFLSAPAVVLYVDGAPFGNNVTYTTDLLDVTGVDVYRGPQGSRFGKNAAAGAINIITRQPTERFGAQGSVSSSSFNTQQYRASARGAAVEDKLFYSVAAQYGTSDGFIDNTYLNSHADQREAANARGSVRWTPGKDWDVSFTATMDRFRDGLGIVSLAGDPRATTSDVDGRIDADANSQSVRVRGVLRGMAVTSVTTRRDYRLDPFLLDPDFSPFPGNTGVITYKQPQWTEELQVRPATRSDRGDWLAGLFLSTSTTEIGRTLDFFVPPSGSGSDVVRSEETAQTYALFGEYTGTLRPGWTLTAGLRLDQSPRQMHRTRTSSFGSPPPVDADESFFNAAPKLTLAWQVRDEVLLYGSTGLGFKPGGFSGFIDPPASPRFDTETTWANEIGAKSRYLGGRLTANLALFYYDVTDYQVEQQTPTGLEFVIANAPEARSAGVELEMSALPASGWELSGFMGYTDARLNRYTDLFSGVTVHDTRAPFVAELNGGAAVQYQHATGLFARVDGNVVGETFYEAGNSAAFRQPAYGLLSARVGFERGHIAVVLFGENLSESEYFLKKIPPLNAGAPGPPQRFGVTVTAR